MSRRKGPAIQNELLDQLLAGGAASADAEKGGLLSDISTRGPELRLRFKEFWSRLIDERHQNDDEIDEDEETCRAGS